MDVTQELVLNYLLEHRGKVRNSDLLKTFKPLLDSPDPQQKANNRDIFKRYVNKIAVVRDEDGSKVVVLKKKYTHLLAGNVQLANTQDQEDERSKSQGDHEEQPENSSVSNNIVEEAAPSDHDVLPQEYISEPNCLSELRECGDGDSSHKIPHEAELGSFNECVPAVPCENEAERESVFAIVSRIDHSGPAPVPKSWSDGQAKDVPKPAMLPLRYTPASFDALDMNENEKTLGHYTGVQENQTPDLPQATPTPSVQDVLLTAQTRSPNVARRQLDDIGSKSPHIKRSSKLMKGNEDHKYSDVVPLIQHEHEWLVSATNGRWNHRLLGLIMIDSDLADKGDFISGFSALHWAAKSGNTEMVKLLFDLSRKGGTNLNVNVRSFGGYTPLHIATIHDHKEVINMLVRDYDANVHIRDNSGRKAYHYLKGLALQLRKLLKDPTAVSPEHGFYMKRNSKVAASILGTTGAFLSVISDDLPFHDLTRGRKKPALNKFFTNPPGAKKKLKARDRYPSIPSLYEEPEEVEEVVGKRRPASEYFTH